MNCEIHVTSGFCRKETYRREAGIIHIFMNNAVKT